MDVPHPIPYQGSKRGLARQILLFFPASIGRLVEPFAGSAAISLAAAARKMAPRFLLNDIDQPLMQLWKQILGHPADLAARYENLWQDQLGRERAYYDAVREQFNRTRRPECLLYLLARCVKAAIRYNACGEFNNSPDNRRKGARPQTMRRHIVGASALLRGRTQICARDYAEVLRECDQRDLIYMDPPYQGVCGKRDPRYLAPVPYGAFCENLAALNDQGCSYLISYDGRSGEKVYGKPLPKDLALTRIEIRAGLSSQATLLGRRADTYESLYLSPALVAALKSEGKTIRR